MWVPCLKVMPLWYDYLIEYQTQSLSIERSEFHLSEDHWANVGSVYNHTMRIRI